MKQTHRSFIVPARLSLSAACAVVLGATATFAQPTGASSSPSGTSTNTDRYGTSSTSSTNDTGATAQKKNQANTSDTYSNSTTGASTSGSTSTYGSSSPSSGSTSSTYSSDTSSTMSHSSDKLSWGDRRFVTKAADDGNDEIALAKLAAERASNPEVRSFAQKLASDHEQVASELSSIASSKNVKIDKDNDHDRTYKRLSKKSGAEFDREFVEHMVEEHEKDIKMFEKAAKDAKDADVRSFASKHVDHLREHLRSAESLRQTIMPTGRMNESSSSGSTSSSTTPGSSSTDKTRP